MQDARNPVSGVYCCPLRRSLDDKHWYDTFNAWGLILTNKIIARALTCMAPDTKSNATVQWSLLVASPTLLASTIYGAYYCTLWRRNHSHQDCGTGGALPLGNVHPDNDMEQQLGNIKTGSWTPRQPLQ